MKTIITIQHAQSVHHTNGMVGSWTDWELSELGVEQANRIGERLKAELFEKKFVMYSSDLLRAKQTAEIVGQYLGLIPILRTELRERNLGKCCGKSVQWLRENLEMQEKTIDFHELAARMGMLSEKSPFRKNFDLIDNTQLERLAGNIKRANQRTAYTGWGAYSGLALNSDWKNEKNRISDLAFRICLTQHYGDR